MAKRCIGIEIGACSLHAVQLCRTGDDFVIEKTFSMQTRRSTDRPAQLLRSLFSRYGFDRRAEVAISMPHDAVFFRNLRLGSAELEKIQSRSSSAVEYHFPIQTDDVVTQVYSCRKLTEEKSSVLAAATSRKALQERLNLLAEAKVYPGLVDAPVSAVHSVVLVNYPQVSVGISIIVYIDDYYMTLAVTEDSDILAVRNIPVDKGADNNVHEQIAAQLSREINITWKRVFQTEQAEGREQITSEPAVQPDMRIYLIVEGSASEQLKSAIEKGLDTDVVIIDPYARVKIAPGCEADSSLYVIAEGLAMRSLAPDKTCGVNFIDAENANAKPELDIRKEMIIIATLIVAIAVFWAFGIFMKLSSLEANCAQLKNEISDVFHKTLPEEQNIVSPLAQLEQRIASFGKDYKLFASFHPSSSSPLEVLRCISASVPSQVDVKVNDLLIAADMVRITGTSDSFESVYKWQQRLKELPDFGAVEVKDVQRQPQSATGGVSFIMLLSSAVSE
jgi:Tfp pilus assembly PilM family ATPase